MWRRREVGRWGLRVGGGREEDGEEDVEGFDCRYEPQSFLRFHPHEAGRFGTKAVLAQTYDLATLASIAPSARAYVYRVGIGGDVCRGRGVR